MRPQPESQRGALPGTLRARARTGGLKCTGWRRPGCATLICPSASGGGTDGMGPPGRAWNGGDGWGGAPGAPFLLRAADNGRPAGIADQRHLDPFLLFLLRPPPSPVFLRVRRPVHRDTVWSEGSPHCRAR